VQEKIMIPVIPINRIDDLGLHKLAAANRIGEILSFVSAQKTGKMVRTASTASTASTESSMIDLFTQMLSCLNLKGNASEALGNLLKGDGIADIKEASIKKAGKDRSDAIKIVSKSVKDSHYQIDVSKDVVSKDGQKVVMVSCYARDAYLGRYLIKRNYFFTPDRERFADQAYDEIMVKVGAIKDRYYNEVIDVHGITTQLKTILDGVVSEIRSEEDQVGNINRSPNG
jgi:hypothetical protein